MILLDQLTPSKMVVARCLCQETVRLMLRSLSSCADFALLALASASCASDDPVDTPTEPSAVSVTENLSETLTVNGARTFPFVANRAGTVTAKFTALSPDDTITLGLSLGTWNGSACQIIIANDTAKLNVSVVGTAQQTGQFCARVYDVGLLTAPTDFTIELTHF
jgi:hypothetical protein